MPLSNESRILQLEVCGTQTPVFSGSAGQWSSELAGALLGEELAGKAAWSAGSSGEVAGLHRAGGGNCSSWCFPSPLPLPLAGG